MWAFYLLMSFRENRRCWRASSSFRLVLRSTKAWFKCFRALERFRVGEVESEERSLVMVAVITGMALPLRVEA